MGFTVYWESNAVSEKVLATFATTLQRVVRPGTVVEVTETAVAFNPPEDRGETFYVSRHDTGSHFCKTHREPYTADVLRALVIMVEIGMAENIHADDDLGYMKELDYVNSIVKLQTLESQKEYFKSIITAL
jgi:hypothetical protein